MQRILTVAIAFVVASTLVCSAGPAASKQRFDSIVTNLDTGGDMLVVVNIEGFFQELVSNLTTFVNAIPKPEKDATEVKRIVDKVPGFLQKNGFFAVQGMGFSIVPRDDGLNTVKSFVARDRGAAGSTLWMGLVGGLPRAMESTGFVPADAVLVRSCTGELPQFWKLVRSGVAEFATPEGRAAFENGLSNLSTNMGVNIDKVIASIGSEGFVSIQLSQTSTVKFGETVSIPTPSILICTAVKDDTLVKAIEQPLTRIKMPIVKTQSGSTVISTIELKLGLPVPLSPSYAICSNFFLLGSSPEVVGDAIKAFNTKSGLTATPEFKKAFAGMPTQNNGILYMSPRFMQTIADVQAGIMDSNSTGNQQAGSPAAAVQSMQSLFGIKGVMQSAFVFINRPDGVASIGVSTSGGKELAGSLMVAPVAMLAAIAVPSFMKARVQSQMNGCVNNLRQIDAAKEQWALEARKQNGDQVDVAGISKYIRGNKIPMCPQGGTYKINPIGTNPECSIPGHGLDFGM